MSINPDAAQENNTNRELWRGPDDGRGAYYADSIHVTQGGGIGIDVGGHVIVKPLRDWHALAAAARDPGTNHLFLDPANPDTKPVPSRNKQLIRGAVARGSAQ